MVSSTTQAAASEVLTASAGAPAGASGRSAEKPEGESFGKVLERLGNEVDRGEKLVHRAVSGARAGRVDAAELIALQAGIYRYTEVVDLTAKLVDRAGSAVRTTLQSGGG
jgi:hypothetical protein